MKMKHIKTSGNCICYAFISHNSISTSIGSAATSYDNSDIRPGRRVKIIDKSHEFIKNFLSLRSRHNLHIYTHKLYVLAVRYFYILIQETL